MVWHGEDQIGDGARFQPLLTCECTQYVCMCIYMHRPASGETKKKKICFFHHAATLSRDDEEARLMLEGEVNQHWNSTG